jgi:hypothetical protein
MDSFTVSEIVIGLAIALIFFSFIVKLPPGPRGSSTTIDSAVRIIKKGMQRNQRRRIRKLLKRDFEETTLYLDDFDNNKDERK